MNPTRAASGRPSSNARTPHSHTSPRTTPIRSPTCGTTHTDYDPAGTPRCRMWSRYPGCLRCGTATSPTRSPTGTHDRPSREPPSPTEVPSVTTDPPTRNTPPRPSNSRTPLDGRPCLVGSFAPSTPAGRSAARQAADGLSPPRISNTARSSPDVPRDSNPAAKRETDLLRRTTPRPQGSAPGCCRPSRSPPSPPGT